MLLFKRNTDLCRRFSTETFVGKYYKSNPWVIPGVPKSLENIFIKYGKSVRVKRNTAVAGVFATVKEYMGPPPCTPTDMIYLKSGMLGQAYEIYDANKPMAISIVLPGRMVNYAAYLRIDNSKEVLITLKNSEILYLSADEFEMHTREIKETVRHYCMQCVASDYDAFTCMFTCDTEKRVAYFYKSLVDTFEPAAENGWMRISVKLSYSVLASVMYTTKKTIERLMPVWQDNGWIKLDKEATHIHASLFEELL